MGVATAHGLSHFIRGARQHSEGRLVTVNCQTITVVSKQFLALAHHSTCREPSAEMSVQSCPVVNQSPAIHLG